MKLSIAIVGLPNVGKSTLFNILTNQNVTAANYPFATIDPNVGIVPVEDERLQKLTELSRSKKTIPAVVEFYDIAGLVKGANQGEGLGNQFLAHIRETQAIVIVLRTFQDANIIHVENSVDPVRDLGIINTELILKDVETVEKRLKSLEAEAPTKDKQAVKNFEVLSKVYEGLLKNQLALPFRDEEIVRELQLLTAKRQLCLINGEESDVTPALEEEIKTWGGEYLTVNLSTRSSIPELSAKAYELLDLISFFTTGEDETRAWTITRGTKAPEAAGVIHTDFEKKFIRAEVIAYEKLVEAAVGSSSTSSIGSPQASSGQSPWAIAKQKGWLRIEGKEYEVKDGDVIVVRHG